jgi:broad specificity phosphatase PhoE
MPPNEETPVVYVVRHGQTVLNKDKRFRGNANPPLDQTGIKQAHELSSLFASKPISHIFCSDKQRSTKTAEIIAQSKSCAIHPSEGLRALDVGKFSGEKRTKEAEADLQRYLDNPEVQIPGGESLQDFRNRIRPCLQAAVNMFMECGAPPVLVAHSSVVHEVGNILYGDHKKILVHPGGAIVVYSKDGSLGAKPIFRPLTSPGTKAAAIT